MFGLSFIAFASFLLGQVVSGRSMLSVLNDTSPSDYSKHMDNRHILMMGDSIMHYQFMSLAYLIHTDTFVSPHERPNILLPDTYETWSEYCVATSDSLTPNVFSDALPMKYENHYYRNERRNLTITFISYAGTVYPPHGYWLPSEKERYPPPVKYNLSAAKPERWRISLEESFTKIAIQLRPRPTVLLLNVGHWPNDWHEAGREKTVLEAAKKNFDRVIWRTTSFNKDHGPGLYAHDSSCSYPGVECLNVNWTQHLAPRYFPDFLHFTPEVYNDMNMQFLYQLTKHKSLDIRPVSAAHLGQIVVYKNNHYIVDKEGLLRPFTAPFSTDTNAVCIKELISRKHVHMPWTELSHHILGDHIHNICDSVVS